MVNIKFISVIRNNKQTKEGISKKTVELSNMQYMQLELNQYLNSNSNQYKFKPIFHLAGALSRKMLAELTYDYIVPELYPV